MAIFEIKDNQAKRIRLSEFILEKDLQNLIENNLEEIFNCQFIASEFSTGNIHSGRIDTLALSEDKNPVIIEYKKVASSDLINQSLYYLHWLKDHRGDFQVIANQSLKKQVDIDWSDIRVICLAPEYKKYDLHAVQVMGANIELWQYRIYENNILIIEDVYKNTNRSIGEEVIKHTGKNPVMVEAGRKAAITRKTASYTIEEHYNKLGYELRKIFDDIRDFIIEIDSSIEEIPKKYYIAYKTSQNFVCLETQQRKILLYLKLNPDDVTPFPSIARDVRQIGHFGTGDLELTIKSVEEFEIAKTLIIQAFKNIGG